MANLYSILRPLFHVMPPEMAHAVGLSALRNGLAGKSRHISAPELHTTVCGLSFPNPIGLAAGFDKNARVINAMLDQGFGFVEAGTVTPRPQKGNRKPRIFRIPAHHAIINRLGFNNRGLEYFVKNFQKRTKAKGIAGANIGKNKDSTSAIADYVAGIQAVYPYADYITVNVSSPNTPGLRDLQHQEALLQLLRVLRYTRAECEQIHGFHVPVWLKVAPDLSVPEMEDIAQAVITYGIDAIVVSNTTISRPESVKGRVAKQEGGLSGPPLFSLSTDVLKQFYRITQGKIPLIGVGGVSSAADAYAKIRAGASLVQLYTALVYQGLSIVGEIQDGLVELLKKDGFTSIQQAVGADAK